MTRRDVRLQHRRGRGLITPSKLGEIKNTAAVREAQDRKLVHHVDHDVYAGAEAAKRRIIETRNEAAG